MRLRFTPKPGDVLDVRKYKTTRPPRQSQKVTKQRPSSDLRTFTKETFIAIVIILAVAGVLYLFGVT